RQVVARLQRELGVGLALAVPDDAPEDKAPHERTHGQRSDRRTDPQAVHAVSLGGNAVRPAETEGLVDRAAGEQNSRDEAEPGQRDHASPTWLASRPAGARFPYDIPCDHLVLPP